jgi:hypothetical protein
MERRIYSTTMIGDDFDEFEDGDFVDDADYPFGEEPEAVDGPGLDDALDDVDEEIAEEFFPDSGYEDDTGPDEFVAPEDESEEAGDEDSPEE